MSIVTEALNCVILNKNNVACTVEDKSFKVLTKWELLTYNINVQMFEVKRIKKK